jgi:hypothetical protein
MEILLRLVFITVGLLLILPFLIIVAPTEGSEVTSSQFWIINNYWITKMFAVVLGIIIGIVVFLLSSNPSKKSGRTLRIDRKTVTLTNATIWGTKEHRMTIDKAIYFSVVDFGVTKRLFAIDFRRSTAYHIEITRNGETFLFPCSDKDEQIQIFKQIKEFLTS